LIPPPHLSIYTGTGKTLVARKLAESSGMDYAVMSGGDVAPLGEDAVNQLHKLFHWAHKSRKGLLLFIDEAEAFLTARTGNNADDPSVRHALNALLYQTGTPSRSFMLILATNRPQELDSAILDRIDVSLQIDLPVIEQRKEMIKHYMELHVLLSSQKQKSNSWFDFRKQEDVIIDEECCSESLFQDIAIDTEGFSGREISKLFIAIHYALSTCPERRLTLNTMKAVVSEKVFEHTQKNGFANSDENLSSPRATRLLVDTGVRTPIRNSERQFNELEAKLARRRTLNGDPIPGIVVMSTGNHEER